MVAPAPAPCRHARTCSGHPRLAAWRDERVRARRRSDVDARNKSGHDGRNAAGRPPVKLSIQAPFDTPPGAATRGEGWVRRPTPTLTPGSRGRSPGRIEGRLQRKVRARRNPLSPIRRTGTPPRNAALYVMPGLAPGIHVSRHGDTSGYGRGDGATWMPGTSPGMTEKVSRAARPSSYPYKPPSIRRAACPERSRGAATEGEGVRSFVRRRHPNPHP